jgi:hypothetical protein
MGDGGIAGCRLKPEQHAGMQQPWRRARKCPERWGLVAFGDRQRGITALSLRGVGRRFLVGLVLD